MAHPAEVVIPALPKVQIANAVAVTTKRSVEVPVTATSEAVSAPTMVPEPTEVPATVEVPEPTSAPIGEGVEMFWM